MLSWFILVFFKHLSRIYLEENLEEGQRKKSLAASNLPAPLQAAGAWSDRAHPGALKGMVPPGRGIAPSTPSSLSKKLFNQIISWLPEMSSG